MDDRMELRNTRRGDGDRYVRALVVSPNFSLRNSHASALEDDGHVTIEAATADEALWHLVSACDDGPIDLIVADAATPGMHEVLAEIRTSPTAPRVVLVGNDVTRRRQVASAIVLDPQRIEELRSAVDRALDAPRPTAARPLRVLLALEGDARREAARLALVRRGVGVIDVGDGLELLEALGAQVGHPDGWRPDAIVVDARLHTMDGMDALGEVRQFDRVVRGLVVADPCDTDARAFAADLNVAVIERDATAEELADATLALCRAPSTPMRVVV
jgi:CheY-like chemotaxis protein